MACDPPGNFLPASYKGIGFYIESAEEAGGRRLAKHEFPNSENWYVEDLGVKTPTYKGTAYVAGDGSSGEVYATSAALLAICNEGGPGPLILPPDIFVPAHCESITRKFEKDKQGWIAFDLEFIGDDVGFGGGQFLIGGGLGPRLIAQAIIFAIDVIAEAGSDWFASVEPTYDARMAASDTIRSAVAALDTAYGTAVVIADRAAETPPLFDALIVALNSFDAAGDDAAPLAYANVVTAFGDYAISITDTTSQPAVIADSLQKTLLAITEPTPPEGVALYPDRTATTVYAQDIAAAVAQASGFSSVLCGMVMAQAYADTEYTTRRQAQLARGRMVATINEIATRIDANSPAIEKLFEARNQSARAIVDKLANIKPVMQISFNQSLPAPYIAWRLYRDPTRAQALAELNNAPHPLFMPAQMEAEAADARSNQPARKR